MTNKVIDIVSATHLRDYEIRLVFNDGTSQTVDFKPFLEHTQHPDIRAFLQPAKFADYRIASSAYRRTYDQRFIDARYHRYSCIISAASGFWF